MARILDKVRVLVLCALTSLVRDRHEREASAVAEEVVAVAALAVVAASAAVAAVVVVHEAVDEVAAAALVDPAGEAGRGSREGRPPFKRGK